MSAIIKRTSIIALCTLMAVAGANAPRAYAGEEDGEEPEQTEPEKPSKPDVIVSGKVIEVDGMIRIPGGIFTIGSNDPKAQPWERPAKKAQVGAFWIDRFETSVAQYTKCVQQKRCVAPPGKSERCTFGGAGDMPINCIRHQDAEAFCHSVGKRLPTELEWEFAARGTKPVRFPSGLSTTGCVHAATLRTESSGRSCTGDRPAKVGTHPAGRSVFGVEDMAGNVEEWTADFFEEQRGQAPKARGSSFVLRGGSWLQPPSMARTTARNWGSAEESGPSVGVRCAKSLGTR
jgi:formylglycine-generating enzyme required for sulfatase activity